MAGFLGISSNTSTCNRETTTGHAKQRRNCEMGMKSSGGGEIIQVQGGHIVRSTGRKDRHSKVYTAKGPRDRRVRLSAYTAIQFYDVQDRLGYDRPSKAVDWLIKKAQSAIDKLAELPPWHPTAGTGETEQSADLGLPEQSESNTDSGYNFQLHNESSSSFVPLDPDAMRSFFPTSSSASSINFQSYPPEIIPRTAAEDLCLSLHSFQDHSNHPPPADQMTLFAGGSDFQRLVNWGSETAENRVAGGGGGGFMFGSPSQNSLMFSSQRGPLQSSYGAPSVRAWDDIPMASASDHRGRFGLPEFCLPEEHGVAPEKPSSVSTGSHH